MLNTINEQHLIQMMTVGDLNKANLKTVLLKFYKHVKCATRENNTSIYQHPWPLDGEVHVSPRIIHPNKLQADPKKIQGVEAWPSTTSRKELQRFANFYRCLIQGFIQVVVPLFHLTSTKVCFSWSPEAESTFAHLKSLFTSAPILI